MPTEAELLHMFLTRRLELGGRKEPVESLLAEFVEYRRELEVLRASLREVEASSARGESRPFDVEDISRRGNERLARDGIVLDD